HRAAKSLGELRPVSRNRSEGNLEGDGDGDEDARHSRQPGRQAGPDARAAAGQRGEQRRDAPRGADRVAEQSQGRDHARPPASFARTARSAADSLPSICATKWLSTASVSPAAAMASRIRRALYSSRV